MTTASSCHFPRTITVPRGRYYLLGDNRGNAFDSRLWGPVPRSRLARVDRCIPQPAVGSTLSVTSRANVSKTST